MEEKDGQTSPSHEHFFQIELKNYSRWQSSSSLSFSSFFFLIKKFFFFQFWTETKCVFYCNANLKPMFSDTSNIEILPVVNDLSPHDCNFSICDVSLCPKLETKNKWICSPCFAFVAKTHFVHSREGYFSCKKICKRGNFHAWNKTLPGILEPSKRRSWITISSFCRYSLEHRRRGTSFPLKLGFLFEKRPLYKYGEDSLDFAL